MDYTDDQLLAMAMANIGEYITDNSPQYILIEDDPRNEDEWYMGLWHWAVTSWPHLATFIYWHPIKRSSMTKELLDEAYLLYQKLSKLCWSTAIDQDITSYNRYKTIEAKALDRYERRFKKFRNST